MINRSHDLPITRQAELLKISRGGDYDAPQPASAEDLAILRRIDELHLEHRLEPAERRGQPTAARHAPA